MIHRILAIAIALFVVLALTVVVKIYNYQRVSQDWFEWIILLTGLDLIVTFICTIILIWR